MLNNVMIIRTNRVKARVTLVCLQLLKAIFSFGIRNAYNWNNNAHEYNTLTYRFCCRVDGRVGQTLCTRVGQEESSRQLGRPHDN